MIELVLSKDKKHLKIDSVSLQRESKLFKQYFKKKSKDSNFNALVDRGIWDGMDHFITKDGLLPLGLWKEVSNFSKDMGVNTNITGLDDTMNLDFNKKDYTDFVNKLFDGIKLDDGTPFYPRDYQFEGGYRAIKYKYCCEELATSAGKTSIFYTYNSYLKYTGVVNKDNKVLLIVPNVSLVNQTVDAFEDEYNNGLVKWNIHKVGGKKDSFDPDKFAECDMLVTTYQSMLNLVPACIENRLDNLIKKRVKKGEEEKRATEITDLKKKLMAAKLANICSTFKVLNVDEAHKSRGNSIGSILDSCVNWEYKLGLSGTLKLDEEYSDFFRMQERVGPLVMMLGAKFLIDNDYSPDIKIKQIFLKYPEKDPRVAEYVRIQKDKELRKKVKDQFRDPKEFGSKMLEIEKGIIFDSQERLEFIGKFTQRLGKNTLILFSDIKNEYGLRIVEELKKWNKHTFYIDGSVDVEDRADYKEMMEKNNDVIIVASWGTFATGINIKNVHHIIFAESVKAEITIRQAIGRGMRALLDKHEVLIWDIIDDLSGYSIKHSVVRFKIYVEQQFEILKKIIVNL